MLTHEWAPEDSAEELQRSADQVPALDPPDRIDPIGMLDLEYPSVSPTLEGMTGTGEARAIDSPALPTHPFLRACKLDHIETLRLILKCSDETGLVESEFGEALEIAATHDRLDVVRILLAIKFDFSRWG